VYASYNQAVTQTHRLSSSGRKGGFQFQNFDRAFKPLFTVRNPGWQLVEGDAPQLEFRIAADLGNDREAKAMIRRGEDVHAMSAKVMRCSRQDAKKDTFGPLYGKISGTPRQQAYFEAFRKKYKDIYATQVGWTHEVLKTGELKTPWGLTFYFPGTKLKEGGYITNTPSIFNYPIQSFATADIIPMVLALVWYRMTDIRGMLVNTIHDSIVAEIHPSDVDAYKGLLIQSFTNDIYPLVKSVYGMTIDVPLGVGIKSGTHWGAGEETKFEPREDITA
jgi:DNA polymerase-1